MKAENVMVRHDDGLYLAYYIGDDAPLLEGMAATHEGAIGALLHEWKRYWAVIDASVECAVVV